MSLVRQANQLFPSRSQFVVDLLSSAVESMEDSNDCVLSCPLEIDTDRVMARIEAALLHPFQHDLVAAASGTAGYALHRCVVCLIVSSVNQAARGVGIARRWQTWARSKSQQCWSQIRCLHFRTWIKYKQMPRETVKY